MEVAERRPFPGSSAAENGSEIANRNSLWGEILVHIYAPLRGANSPRQPASSPIRRRYSFYTQNGRKKHKRAIDKDIGFFLCTLVAPW